MEYLREAKITLERDTNKATRKHILERYEGESWEEFIERVIEKIKEFYLDEYEK